MEAVLTRFSWILPALLLSSAAAAQEGRDVPSRVPASFTPPAGMCRLWIDGVPASQQPAPTDCASAIRNRPTNAAVVFGPQRRSDAGELTPFGRGGKSSFVRQLAPGATAGRGRPEPARATDRAADRAAERADTAARPAPRKPEKPQ